MLVQISLGFFVPLYKVIFVNSCHPQLRVGLQAHSRSSSPISAQTPQAMPFRWLKTKVRQRSSILRTPQESHEESSVHLFSVGVNPPRPHEPLHVRGPSLGTSLHKCPSPGVSPSLRSNPLCGRRHLDCKLFDYCCPGAEPAHAANRSRVVGQFSSLTRLFSAYVWQPPVPSARNTQGCRGG